MNNQTSDKDGDFEKQNFSGGYIKASQEAYDLLIEAGYKFNSSCKTNNYFVILSNNTIDSDVTLNSIVEAWYEDEANFPAQMINEFGGYHEAKDKEHALKFLSNGGKLATKEEHASLYYARKDKK